jgi:glutaredoxin
VDVVLYTRQSCHLCDDAHQLLERARQSYDLRLQCVDIDEDPQLQARFGAMVPVVAVEGKVRFHGRISPVLLSRLLRATFGR